MNPTTLLTLMLMKAGFGACVIHQMEVFHSENTIQVRVKSVPEVFAAEEVAKEFQAKYGWEVLVAF